MLYQILYVQMMEAKMEILDWIIEASGIAMACFLLGFCGSLGVVTAFVVGTRFFSDSDDVGGVIGH